MLDLTKLARKTFGRHLENDEEVIAAANATATGTGGFIGTGLVIGILGGALYAVIVSTAAALPVMTLGGFVGIVGGTGVAEAAARRPTGPGATSVTLAMTNGRLLILRRQPAIRLRPLRIFQLDEIDAISATPSPIGKYQRTRINLADGLSLSLLVAGHHNFAGLHREQRDDFAVD
jgi:hypothetical protein